MRGARMDHHIMNRKLKSAGTTCAWHVPTAGDIIAARRVAFFNATLKYGLRSRTLAPPARSNVRGAQGKNKVWGQVLGFGPHPEPGQTEAVQSHWIHPKTTTCGDQQVVVR